MINCTRCGAPLNPKGFGKYTCEYCGEEIVVPNPQDSSSTTPPAIDVEKIKQQLRAQVREWIDEWKKLKTLIAEMGDAQRACLQTLKKNRKDSSKLP